MADLSSILMALGLSAGLHPWGHYQAGNDVGVPVGMNWRQGTESWDTGGDKRKDVYMDAGGFDIQDRVSEAIDDPNLRIANALYKAGYLAGIKPSQTEGDPELMERLSGNKMTKELLAATVLFDLWKSQNAESNFNLRFVAPEGTPGLVGTWRW
jgi:hypothetical protein